MDNKEVYDILNSCTSLSMAAMSIFNKNSYRDCEKIKKLSEKVGFDWTLYKERRKRKKIKCKNCGEEFIQKYKDNMFCCQSCAAIFNNKENSKSKITSEKCIFCGKILDREKNQKKFCSTVCQMEYKYNNFIIKWKNDELTGIRGKCDISSHIRKFLFIKYNSKCQLCGWGEINPYTNKVPLQIHHIDGDCTNNKEDNLQLLCPNCHSLTDTFGSLNKDSKRVYRKK